MTTAQLILFGLPLTEVNENELHDFVAGLREGQGLESCTIIQDKKTKRSKNYAFLQFHNEAAARKFHREWGFGNLFMNEHELRIDEVRDARSEIGSWTCDDDRCRSRNFARRESCYKCQRLRPEIDFNVDTSAIPSQFLQISKLPPDTTPQQIMFALDRLHDVRVERLLLLEGRSQVHVPVAFIEFPDVNTASRALTLASAFTGKGFCIKNKPVSLAYIHAGVFIPITDNHRPGTFQATNSPQLLAYWNEEYLCTAWTSNKITTPPPVDSFVSSEPQIDSQNKRKRKAMDAGVTTKSIVGTGSGMISHWSRKQEELHGTSPSIIARSTYAEGLLCLLCCRKFTSEADLKAHELKSGLHAKNLQDQTCLEKAESRFKPTTAQSTEYRDRALERRATIKASGQVLDRPTAKHKVPRNTSPPESVDRTNKGRQMMQQLGYVGGGLGSHGQGAAEPVQAQAYLPGVGLGTAGAKLDAKDAEARRSAGGYTSFVKSVRENARSRYEKEST